MNSVLFPRISLLNQSYTFSDEKSNKQVGILSQLVAYLIRISG